jgi:signal peptidase I
MSDWTSPSDPVAGQTSGSPSPETPSQNSQDSYFQKPHESSVNSVWQQLRVWGRDLAVSLCLAGFVILFLYQPVKVEGTSMEPRLTDQERVFINKFIYKFESVEQGDVVVFWYPKDITKSFIKRVVGVPGDRVEMHSGQLFVNGKQIAEPYLSATFRGMDSFAPVLVPAGEYFVLGDHRTSSNDSRSWGMVPQKFIYGKAELVYWPVGKWGLLD